MAEANSITEDRVVDVVVVGGGAMGAWSTVHLAKAGKSVVLLEQFECAHDQGSSHGDGRVYRKAYSESRYIDMMTLSMPMWEELERFQGQVLIHETGFVMMGTLNESDSLNICSIAQTYALMKVPHEILTAEETSKRFPQFRIPPHFHCLFSPEGGVLSATGCIRALWKYARSLGACTKENFAVESIQRMEDRTLKLTSTNGVSVTSRHVVFAPGSWLSSICRKHFQLDVPTRVTAETVCYYKPRRNDGTDDVENVDYTPKSMPVFMIQNENGINSFGFYGTPDVGLGVKAAAHYAGPEIADIDRRPLCAGGRARSNGAVATSVEEERIAKQVISNVLQKNDEFIQSVLPGLDDQSVKQTWCLYTSTPDHDFVISYVPGWDRDIVIVGGGSGHAFKMSPAIGAAAAALVSREVSPFDVSPFDVGRIVGQTYSMDQASLR